MKALLEVLSKREDMAAVLNEVVATLPDLSEEQRNNFLENPLEYFFPAASKPPADSIPNPRAAKPDDLLARINKALARRTLNMELPAGSADREILRQTLNDLLNQVVEAEGVHLSRAEKERLIENMLADIIGFGAIDAYMRDDTVTEIRVLGPKQIYIVRKGHFEAASQTFENDGAVLRVIDRITAPQGIRVDESNPMARVRMHDGSLVTMIVRPLAQQGPSLYIQKMWGRLSAVDLMRFGTAPAEAMDFIYTALVSGVNIVVAGGTGGGKTSLMNVLADRLSLNPQVTGIVTIEPVSEFQLSGTRVLSLETRPPNIEGKGEVNADQLAEFAVQFHPERVILGGTNGAGIVPLMESGTPFMVEANAAADELVEQWREGLTAAGMATRHNPLRVMRVSVLLVEIRQLPQGMRRITRIAEFVPDGTLIDLFQFHFYRDADSPNAGELRVVKDGVSWPVIRNTRTLKRMKDAGFDMGPLFDPKAGN
ncbi:MAG: CpaF family protein [Anaerolineae bacterium]|nr:CpaF family protein [Anaerolineae bacterium]